MLKTRVIPCLLFKETGLFKTVKFKDPKYVGDAVNAIRIFNEKEVDELIFLDIAASKSGKKPNLNLVKDISSECFMPLCYGGGIRSTDEIKEIFALGVEKVAINSHAIENTKIISEASNVFGNQSIVAAIDVRKNIMRKYKVYDHSKDKITDIDPIEYALKMQDLGAGEILLNSVDRDGVMRGYDVDLIKKVSDELTIPLIALGGAGSMDDFVSAVEEGHASSVSAGSMFVFHGKHRAVLITYPGYDELVEKLN